MVPEALPDRPVVQEIDARIVVYGAAGVENFTWDDGLFEFNLGEAVSSQFRQAASLMFAETVEIPSSTSWRDAETRTDAILELEAIEAHGSVNDYVSENADAIGPIVLMRICIYNMDFRAVACWDAEGQAVGGNVCSFRAAPLSCIVATAIREATADFMVKLERDPRKQACGAEVAALRENGR